MESRRSAHYQRKWRVYKTNLRTLCGVTKMLELKTEEFNRLIAYLHRLYGLDLTKKQFLVESKLSMELQKRDIQTFSDFWQQLQRDTSGELQQLLVDVLTTNYTYFYREEAHFEFLQKIVAEFQGKRKDTFKVWSAGCSTGQEAYVLAMQLLDAQKQGYLNYPYTVLGTDVSERVIEKARQGKYAVSDYVRLPRAWQLNYCMFANGSYEIKKAIREQVEFRKKNLMLPLGTFEQFNVIFCRNVMIYFDEAARKRLLYLLIDALVPGGYLCIGHAEIITGQEANLEYIQPAVYRKVGG